MQTINGIPAEEVLEAFSEAAEDFLFEVKEGKPIPTVFDGQDIGTSWYKGLGWYFVSPDGPKGVFCCKTKAQRGLIEDMLEKSEMMI